MANFKLEKYLKCPECQKKRVVAQVWKNRFYVKFVLSCCSSKVIDRQYDNEEQITRKNLKQELSML